MRQYHNLLEDVLDHGEERQDRTGTGTLSVFGRQARYDLRNGFPLVTTKKVHFKSILTELLWFLRGDTNTSFLKENGVSIWDEWENKNGDLGPVYGKQWRSWDIFGGRGNVDQIAEVIDGLQSNPTGRRHIVSAWNVADLQQMALPPCHLLFQFYVHEPHSERPGLSCQLYQRSADLFLGVPFNIASYALLTRMIAQVCGYEAREFVHTIGDAHIYKNHIDQVREQLSRKHLVQPTVWIHPGIRHIDSFCHEHFELIGYDPHPAIKAPVAV